MYLSVEEIAKKWNLSARSVRNYCSQGRVDGAFLKGKTWLIPHDAKKPQRINSSEKVVSKLLKALLYEKKNRVRGRIYHKIQIDLTYNSNHIEGNKLSHDETRYIFETNTINDFKNNSYNVDDIVETANHFNCVDLIIKNAKKQLNETFIKQLHYTLKNGTSDSRKNFFNVGEYKKLPNEVAGNKTTNPKNVSKEMQSLIEKYNNIEKVTLYDIIDFHHKFECIHPFQDGNGRIGRLIMFKECLKNNIVPFIIEEKLKLFYYRGLKEWNENKGYLLDTCLFAQDKFKKHLDYFQIPYDEY